MYNPINNYLWQEVKKKRMCEGREEMLDKQQVEDIGTDWQPKYLYSSVLYACYLYLYMANSRKCQIQGRQVWQ